MTTHTIKLAPVGAVVEDVDGEPIELSFDRLQRIASETNRWIQKHREAGSESSPVALQSAGDPHGDTGLRWGSLQRAKVVDGHLVGEFELHGEGEAKAESGELATVSLATGKQRDSALGEEFSPVILEVSPTNRPQIHTAQLSASRQVVCAALDGKQVSTDDVDESNSKAVASTGSQSNSNQGTGMEDQNEESQQADTEASEEVETEQNSEMSVERARELAEKVEAMELQNVSELIEEVRSLKENLQSMSGDLSEVMDRLAPKDSGEPEPKAEDDALEQGRDEEGELADEIAASVKREVVAELTGQTTELGSPESGEQNGTPVLQLSQSDFISRYDSYDEAYHATLEAARQSDDIEDAVGYAIRTVPSKQEF